MDYFEEGYIRTMKLAGYEVTVDPSDAFHMGSVAKKEDKSYLGPSALSGAGAAAGAGGLAGGKFRALTGKTLAGTLQDVRKGGIGSAISNIQAGHREAMGDAVDAVYQGRGFSNALKHVDTEKYLRRFGKGGLLGAGIGLGLNTLGNLASYGAGHAVTDDPTWWDKAKGVF